MTSIVDECAQQCLLPDGQSTLYDALPPFDDELARDVTVEELSLPAPAEPLEDHQGASGSSLPATPAERPCTFCPSSLPLPPATCPARATLVLDLDGTLIASEELNAVNSAYLWNTPAGARTPDYEAMGRRVWLRPGVREFLAAVRPNFEIVLFTAATQNWAAAAIEQLDPSAELFDVMLHRDHTTSDLVWDYVKDLSRLGRDLARVVIVDDNPLMFMYQPDNALHIGAYEAAIAGGADNVLPRVAEVLINQVAPAIDVREVLGPMASAKSCITSTVSAAGAAQAAAEPQGQMAADVASVEAGSACAIDGHEAVHAMDCNAVCGAVSSSEGEGMQCDASGDEGWSVGGFADAEVQSHEQQHPHEDGPTCSRGLGKEDGSTLSNDAERGIDWDGESEGAETFDEHGAAAQLGEDVSGSCQRHHALDSTSGDICGAAAVAATAVLVQESGEQEESDSCPPNEHSSEDFEALMDDAMAEYDSDAYEGSYSGGAGYDYACPADTAVAATVLPETLVLADHAAAGSQSGIDCCEVGFPLGSGLRPCVRPASCPDSGAMAQQSATGQDASGNHACSGAAAAGAACCSDGAAAAAADATSQMAAAVAAAAAAASLACSEAAGALAPLLQCQAADDAQRQSPLPRGMVFLMDLNPAFGTPACVPADAVGGCEAGAPPALAASSEGDCDVSRAGEYLGCKRARPEAEADGEEPEGQRGVVARLSCEGTPRSGRVHVMGADAQL
ncbi:hypothetical protein PLESTB_000387100 [Pleodorina starrii]|uniref:FCP1 homology domain-containing protein n=1 Tax=Pleodorina starrii TaxID=330485 RepID=A0A9W6EZV6_9CHLO|nr:hypothetical protein PLESTM_000007800 [Pleodorina starrii]GLC50506.1 hypothetical protein PLESTB_000387100 [Pleodorina starrii]GLC73255.1 hypothetical protein PLESTF_001352600 [Pleodorina starrii]